MQAKEVIESSGDKLFQKPMLHEANVGRWHSSYHMLQKSRGMQSYKITY